MDNNDGGVWQGIGGPIRVDHADLNGIDPALMDCCRREAESNRKYAALTTTLQRHDVIAMAERRRRHLVNTPSFQGCRCCYDPNSDGGGDYRALAELRAIRKEEAAEETDQEDSPVDRFPFENYNDEKRGLGAVATAAEAEGEEDSDDEFDYLLDEDLPGDNNGLKALEEMRRAELEMAMIRRQIAQLHGYGVHRQMHPTRVLKVAGLARGTRTTATTRDPPPAVVLHLFDPDSRLSASLDLCLEELAEKWGGTVFLRSGGRSVLLMDPGLAQRALKHVHVDRDLPILIAIRNGAVINMCPCLKSLGENYDVDSRAVADWLSRCDVLLSEVPLMEAVCGIRPEEEALLDMLDATQPIKVEERYDCGIPSCQKDYPHEHVGFQNDKQDGLLVTERQVSGCDDIGA